MKNNQSANRRLIVKVSSYISRSAGIKLPPQVVQKAKHQILDTLAAMISGSTLKPGQLARKFAQRQGGTEEAQVVGSSIVTSAIQAALANGMMAHADETDDAHPRSQTHPGCAVVPAALAMAEREEADGPSFINAVVAGYEIGCRTVQSIGVDNLRQKSLSTHSLGGNFAAAAAAAVLAKLSERQNRYVLSYAAQQASGFYYWMRDAEHVEKAFVFGGMPARNGVTAAIMIQSGFTGVSDPFAGNPNFFEAFAPDARPQLLVYGLGRNYEIMSATMKKFPVGLPIQAPLEALLSLLEEHNISSKDVKSVTAHIHAASARVIDNRDMPDINLQHLLAITLVDGGLTFPAAHSYDRMKDPAVLKVRKRITLKADNKLIPYQSVVEITTKGGVKLQKHVHSMAGTAENPMTTQIVEKKCRDLLVPVLGEDRSTKLIDKIWNLEQVNNLRELRPLLAA